MSEHKFPEVRPYDDAEFTTPKGQFAESRCVAARLSQSTRGERPDQVELMFEVGPSQVADRAKNEKLGIQKGPGDVAGWFVFHTGSLNGGAADITFKTLRVCGMDPAAVRERLKDDVQAQSIAQVLRSKQETEEQVDRAFALLLLTRAGKGSAEAFEALGLGANAVRLVVMDDEFPAGSGKWRRRCNYVNPIPRLAEEGDVLAILGGLQKPAAPGAAQPKRQATSAPPAGGNVAKDNVEF